MRLLTIFVCLFALTAAGCAGSGMQPRKGLSLQEARGLCITYLPGNDTFESTCGGSAHHDICDSYMDPLPDMTDRAACLTHCQDTWETLLHRYTGFDCSAQIPRGKELCRQYCLGLP